MNATHPTLSGLVLERCVAENARARVYLGRQGDQPVAVKLYAPGSERAVAERVRREALAQRGVTHRAVARLLDAGVTNDGSPYLVSEWIPGTTLEVRLAAGPMRWEELAPVLSRLAEGLVAIHAAGVVHRDLKPSNVMLPVWGAVILDFGHALVLGEPRVTESGWILGSTAYMAPEQAAGHTLDARTDLYAFGVILYRALTGHLPFFGPSPAEVLRQHRMEPVVPPRQRAPERNIPQAAEDLCMWLLAKDPSHRLPSTRVLAITLGAMAPAPSSAWSAQATHP